MPECEDAGLIDVPERGLMAFGLFRNRRPEPAAPAIAPQAAAPMVVIDSPGPSDSDSAREILELLELELGAMIRQLERAGHSAATGPRPKPATAPTLPQRRAA